MQLRAVLGRDDVASVLKEITPLRVELSRRPQRVISIGRPTELTFVPDAGIRVRFDARAVWDVVGLAFPVTARSIRVLLVPRVERARLALDLQIEELELESVPSFVEGRVKSTIDGALAAQRERLAIDLARVLHVGRELSEKISPAMRFELGATAADIRVTADALVLDVRVAASVVPSLRGGAARELAVNPRERRA